MSQVLQVATVQKGNKKELPGHLIAYILAFFTLQMVLGNCHLRVLTSTRARKIFSFATVCEIGMIPNKLKIHIVKTDTQIFTYLYLEIDCYCFVILTLY